MAQSLEEMLLINHWIGGACAGGGVGPHEPGMESGAPAGRLAR